MLDSQYEGIVKLLEELSNNLIAVVSLCALTFLVCLLIFAIMLCSSYVKSLYRKRIDEDARIKRIVEESKRDDSKV